jgi:excisionase family DNA binding protein
MVAVEQRQHPGDEDDEAFSRREAMRRLGNVSKQTMLELERQGRLRAVRIGRRVVYPRSEIVRLLAAEPK